MAYLRPPAFQRNVFNKLAMWFGIGGAETLVIRGRQSGEPRSVPVIPVEVDGARYIVSVRGESRWVQNLRAANGECELRGKGRTERLIATEVPAAERAPLLASYQAKAGRTVKGYFEKLPAAADHPVFRVRANE